MTKKIYSSEKFRFFQLLASVFSLGFAILIENDNFHNSYPISFFGIFSITFSMVMFINSFLLLLGYIFLSTKSRFVIYEDHIVIPASFYRKFNFRFSDEAVTYRSYPGSISFFVNSRKVHRFQFFGLSKESVKEIESLVRLHFKPSAS